MISEQNAAIPEQLLSALGGCFFSIL